MTNPTPIVSLAQRGRDLLKAVRNQHLSVAQVASAAPLPVAYVVPAETTIDAEMAVLAMARRLAGEPGANGRPIGLLMLDPLGATLRTISPAGHQPLASQKTYRPQRRVADRPGWDDLLARLPGDCWRLLVLDLTGGLHNLAEPGGGSQTVVVVARTSADGRVAGYRKLKELAAGGIEQVAFFFVEDPPNGSPPPHTVLAERAEATFARLAVAARQFLRCGVNSLGCATEPPPPGLAVELLGQRPSLNGQDNRYELTRWLAEHTVNPSPLAGEVPASAGGGGAASQPTAESGCAHTCSPSPRGEGQGEGLAEPEWLPTAPAQNIAEGGCATSLLSSDELADLLPSRSLDKRVQGSGDAVQLELSQPESRMEQPRRRGLPVAAADEFPADDASLADALVRNPQLVAANSALSFRPPTDPTATLLARADGKLLIARGGLLEPLAGITSLTQCERWAMDHWPLLRLAYTDASLADAPTIECTLILRDQPSESVRLLAARCGVAIARILDLDTLGVGESPFGVTMVSLGFTGR